MASLVIDANLALAWVLPYRSHTEADALLRRIERGDDLVGVPSHFYAEVFSTLVQE